MGSIANAAAMKAFTVANSGQSGTIPMVKAYKKQEAQKEKKKHTGTELVYLF